MKSILTFLRRPIQWFKRQSRRKKIAFSVILIIFVFFIARQMIKGQRGPEYLTEYPKYESITETVTETGNVVTSARVDVYSTTTGVVDELLVSNRDVVSAGDPLFSAKSTATQQEKNTARSNYLTAKSTLDAAKATAYSLQATMFDTWDEFKNLAESGTYEKDDGTPKNENRTLPAFIISQNEWLAAEAHYKNQQQKIAQAQAQTNAMWEAYQATQDSTVYATIEGTIYNVSIAETDAVQVRSTTAQPVLVIADLSKTRVAVQLNEVDIPKVSVGQNATIEIDAIPAKEYKGIVDAVDTIGQNVEGVVTYNVYISLSDPEPGIKPGMTARVNIVVAEKENTLTVSSSAVRPHEGGRAVQVVNPQTKELEFIPVEIGLRGNGRTEIVSGIDEHTEIIQALTNEQVDRPSGGFFGG
ncbi:MAG: Efflux transporter, RND family, MFP subunit [Candidatus Roizmanbacteria bacterium GW2011_GWB1_40_7]|uniref:Efflux transporter, RND family, MFP subunit n=2 Tax=Candidatus Roizmaniibacteriota TaxID=1752723 RepID=A0A0G0T9B9_9BACT|nr:MAG: Efflux transporter, RND family, MFP subunit [Candidatus Roizmanbacteria bacterium GW2011_GWB1_40_7]KKR92171.1 MAG: Efflux transporter, RND family, MFP subunit [Candidatus Roizmanbacteria bacterium GW2011_GWA1_41_13]